MTPAEELRATAKAMREPVRPMMEWATDRAGVAAQIELLARVIPNVHITPSGCWEWTASKDIYGYGKASRDGDTAGAHRWLWERIVGPVPDGLELDHLCRVKHCVNPEHLEPVPPAENIRRQKEDRGLYVCTRHGPKTPTQGGYFRCKPCRAERARKRRARLMNTEPKEHGTRSSYINYGCRCDPCSAAQAVYTEARKSRKVSTEGAQ